MHLVNLRARVSGALLFLACAATAPAQSPQPGSMLGRAVDARGAPLAGVEVIADNTQFYDINAIGVTDAEGRYAVDTRHPPGTWVGSARITRTYNGKRFVLELDPDSVDAFAGNVGAVRNFTWKLSGERRDGLGTYGMSVIYYFEGFEDPQFPGEFLDTDFVELTLTPVGPLVDGSVGAAIVARGERTPDGPAVRDVPIGRYTITARYLAPGLPVRPLLLRIRNTGNYVPALTADFDEVLETLYRIEMDVTIDTAFIFDGDFESAPDAPRLPAPV
ncbi:carboxypeptidase regulatory-like domain-containing protein [Chiayiivirga flava]|uniref:Carboxypeptidase regulatory-like domain-containing protein n=1 Tax=Chiayiivirga flava TaxID=659595 RepID=A0A7W8D926_9GAMM|nr:carboxypeptidase regulatory-like domain-containing protein [Chiayiivirga flava]MBB5208383.1 hypothetical protein [Chiayiivirga flava]